MACWSSVWSPIAGWSEVSSVFSSLEEAASFEPKDGVYTVFRTYPGRRVQSLAQHLARLDFSWAKVSRERQEKPVCVEEMSGSTGSEGLTKRALRSMLNRWIVSAGWECARVRLTRSNQGELFVAMERFVFPYAKEKKEGVSCVTLSDVVRDAPEVKQARWMEERKRWSASLPEGVHTAILLGEYGELLEGLDCNVSFIVGGRLRTATQGVLFGTSLRITLEVASGILSVVETPVNKDALTQIEEAFLSSSSRGILPIVKIDGVSVGDGKVGARTQALQKAYDAWIEDSLELLAPSP